MSSSGVLLLMIENIIVKIMRFKCMASKITVRFGHKIITFIFDYFVIGYFVLGHCLGYWFGVLVLVVGPSHGYAIDSVLVFVCLFLEFYFFVLLCCLLL